MEADKQPIGWTEAEAREFYAGQTRSEPPWSPGESQVRPMPVRDVPPETWEVVKARRWVAFPPDNDVIVWLQLEERNGRTICRSAYIESRGPLSREEVLKNLRISHRLPIAAEYEAEVRRRSLSPEDLRGLWELPQETAVSDKRPGRRGHSAEDYEKVAAGWRRARLSHPTSPMKETATQIGYSVAQTRRLVRKAQELGFITKQEEGQ